MILQLFEDFFPFVLAIIFGFAAREKMSPFSKLIYRQIILGFVFLILSYIVTFSQKAMGLQQNNQWLHNIYLPLETLILLAAYRIYFNQTKLTQIIAIISFCVIGLAFILELITKGVMRFVSYTDAVESVIMLILFGLILYAEFSNHDLPWWKSAHFYITAGLVIFFACGIPYISLFDFLQENHSHDNKLLFRVIVPTLAGLRYIMAAVGFWQLRKDYKTEQI